MTGWRERALCGTAGYLEVASMAAVRVAEAFFPHPSEYELIAAAKAVCARCPVRAECLDEAMSAGMTDGIWGGMTPEERRLLSQVRAGRGAA